MKASEVMRMPIGTVLFQASLEVNTNTGAADVRVIECTVRPMEYDRTKRGAFVPTTFRGKEIWNPVRSGFLFKTAEEAWNSLRERVSKLRDSLDKFNSGHEEGRIVEVAADGNLPRGVVKIY